MLEVGDKAPSFTLPDQNGEKVTLSKLKGETASSTSTPAPTPQAARPKPAACVIAAPSTRRPAHA
jgi:hypothetical protein